MSAIDTNEQFKQQAAMAALTHICSGMVVGLGTGSTARHFILGLAEALKTQQLHDVVVVPTSLASAALASEHGIPIIELPETGVDIAVDGADEINYALNLTKGMGGALLREKIVATVAKTFIVIADDSKLVRVLGERSPIPLEVSEFGLAATLAALRDLEGTPVVRQHDGAVIKSDNGNLIVECRFKPISNTLKLEGWLKSIPGVLQTGIFIDLADLAYIASPQGLVVLDKPEVLK
jgi:ribose 5-phosphate isomerase A